MHNIEYFKAAFTAEGVAMKLPLHIEMKAGIGVGRIGFNDNRQSQQLTTMYNIPK